MTERVGIEAYLDPRELEGGVRKANRSLDSLTRSALETEKQVTGINRSVKLLGGVIAGAITFESARRILDVADNFQILDQRIRTATRGTGDYLKVSREIQDIALDNGTALESTVDQFQRISIGAQEIGASSGEVLTLTRAVQQLGIIGGTTQEALNNSMLQFSQGLAAGVLRAEEFNSVVENTPLIAQKIAQGMGLTVGQLRAAVLEGKVLSKDVFESIVKQAPEIAKEFEEIPTNLDRSFTKLSSSIQIALGSLDKEFGFTASLAEFVDEAADAINPVRRLENELATLEARLEGGSRGSGRSRKTPDALKRQIAGVKQELLEAKAAAGDIDATRKLLAGVNVQIERFQSLSSSSGNATAPKRRSRSIVSRRVNQVGDDNKRLQELLGQRQRLESSIAELEKPKGNGGEEKISPTGVTDKKLSNDLARLEKFYLTAEQVEESAFDKRVAIAKNALDQKLIDEERYGEIYSGLASNHFKRIAEIESEEAERREQALAESREFERARLAEERANEILYAQGYDTIEQQAKIEHYQRLGQIQLEYIGASKKQLLELSKFEFQTNRQRAASAVGLFAKYGA